MIGLAEPSRWGWFWPLALISTLAACLASLTSGAVDVSFSEVLEVLQARLGGSAPINQTDAVVWGLRVPRILAGLIHGAVLALTGAALQGLLRNQLADSQLLGIAPGAAIGGVVGTAAWGLIGGFAGSVAAGIVAALVLQALTRRATVDSSRIILTGVALGALLSAWVGFLVFAASRSAVPPVAFWLLGSLATVSWPSLSMTAMLLVLPVTVLLGAHRRLDLMSLGEADAKHLGLNTQRTKTVVLVASGAAVGASVGAIGVVAFVGLAVPFVIRPLVGVEHRRLLPASMICGGLFIVLADLAARSVFQPVEIPVGVVTAVVAGPLFLWLLTRQADV